MFRKCSRIDLEKLKICSEIALEVLWLVAVCGNFQVILERIQSNLLQGTWAVLVQFTLFEHYQRAISVQSDCSSRATVEEFLSSWSRALSEQFWYTLKTKRFAQFQNSFSAIWEQITLHHLNYQTQSSLGAILVQLRSNFSVIWAIRVQFTWTILSLDSEQFECSLRVLHFHFLGQFQSSLNKVSTEVPRRNSIANIKLTT